MLGIMYVCMLSFVITQQAVPPVLPLIIADLQMTHAEAGLLMSLISLPGIILAIVAGLLADRYGQKLMGVLAFSVLIAGTIVFASGSSIGVLLAGRLLAGIGAVTLTVLAAQLVAQWFIGREMGTAMGIFNTAMPLASILAMSVLPFVAGNFGWRGAVWSALALPALSLVLFAVFFKPAPGRVRQAGRGLASAFRGLRTIGVPIWIVGTNTMLFNCAMIGLLTFTPDLLKSSGFSLESAGAITGATMWAGLLLSAPMGYLVDRVGQKRLLIGLGGLALGIFAMLTPWSLGWILPLMALVGLAKVPIPPPQLALTSECTSPDRMGLAYGITAMGSQIGAVVGPASAGLMRDMTGSYFASYVLIGSFALLMPVAMLVLRWKQGPLTRRESPNIANSRAE